MPLDEDNIIAVEQTAEELAAEEQAFASAFNEGRGIEPEPDPAPVEKPAAADAPSADSQKDDPTVAGGDKPAADPAQPAPTAPEPRLIAGLTEEQVAAALARSGSLQTTVDKMAGRIGQLMQQLEALKTNPPTTQQAQKALDIKLEKLSAAFPELAAILKEDLAGLSGGTSAPVAEAPPPGLTQEQLDEILNARLAATSNQTKEMIETRVLSVIHPDWMQVIRDPSFALFRDNVLPEGVGKQLMESEDAGFIAGKLTEYKAWREAQKQPTPAPAQPAVPPTQRRLANAVLPATTKSTPTGPVTEEDAFAAAFKQERARNGG